MGMTRTEYQEYLNSAHWRLVRKNFLTPYSPCERCWMPRWLARIAYDQDLHVHHRSYANLGEERRGDLEGLCRRCHEIETFGRSDLKAPPSHKCPICGIPTWNPFSDDCNSCTRLKLNMSPLPENILQQPTEYGSEVWKRVLVEMSTEIGPFVIMEFLNADIDGLLEDHQSHIEAQAEKAAKVTTNL